MGSFGKIARIAVTLPRQSHVTVVENNSEAEIRRASWLFPLYLVLINLFVLPIAMAGLLTFPAGKVDSDMFVLALPLIAKSDTLTLLAFIGGLCGQKFLPNLLRRGRVGAGPLQHQRIPLRGLRLR